MMLKSGCTKLRDFIDGFRECKNKNEEDSYIAREAAAIRSCLREDIGIYRHRNIVKLMYMNLLGYPVGFGQLDCVKLIASPRFLEKRIGYLALPVLLDKHTDVLMLATNTMKTDMTSSSEFVVSSAMNCLSLVGTGDMVASLKREIEGNLVHALPLIRKKAVCLAARLVLVLPEVAPRVSLKLCMLLADSNHGVFGATLNLVNALIKQLPVLEISDRAIVIENLCHAVSSFIDLIACLTRTSNSLPGKTRVPPKLGNTRHNISSDYEYHGIGDPFLLIRTLKSLKLVIVCLTKNGINIGLEQLENILVLVEILTIHSSDVKNISVAVVGEALRVGIAIVQQRIPSHVKSTIDPGILWQERFGHTLQCWIDLWLASEVCSLNIFGVTIALNAPVALLNNDSCRTAAVQLIKSFDVCVRVKAVKLLGHVATAATCEVITEKLFDFLGSVKRSAFTDIDPCSAGKNFCMSGTSAKKVCGAVETVQVSTLYNTIQQTAIDTIEQVVKTHSPSKSWEIEMYIKLVWITDCRISQQCLDRIFINMASQPLLWSGSLNLLCNALKKDVRSTSLAELTLRMLIHTAYVTGFDVVTFSSVGNSQQDELSSPKATKVNLLEDIFSISPFEAPACANSNQSHEVTLQGTNPPIKSLMNMLKTIGITYEFTATTCHGSAKTKQYTHTGIFAAVAPNTVVLPRSIGVGTDIGRARPSLTLSLEAQKVVKNPLLVTTYVEAVAAIAARKASERDVYDSCVKMLTAVADCVPVTEVHLAVTESLAILRSARGCLLRRVHTEYGLPKRRLGNCIDISFEDWSDCDYKNHGDTIGPIAPQKAARKKYSILDDFDAPDDSGSHLGGGLNTGISESRSKLPDLFSQHNSAHPELYARPGQADQLLPFSDGPGTNILSSCHQDQCGSTSSSASKSNSKKNKHLDLFDDDQSIANPILSTKSDTADIYANNDGSTGPATHTGVNPTSSHKKSYILDDLF